MKIEIIKERRKKIFFFRNGFKFFLFCTFAKAQASYFIFCYKAPPKRVNGDHGHKKNSGYIEKPDNKIRRYIQ